MNKQDFRKIIEERIKDEQKAASFLHVSIGKTDNPVIKLMLYQLALDSAKHDHLLQAALLLLDSPSAAISKMESEEFRDAIKKHVEIEENMLDKFEEIVDLAEDKQIRFILEEIISDEKKHHAITMRIHKLVCEDKKVSDEKWWDFLYRYSKLAG